MAKKNDVHKTDPEVVHKFLTETAPFKELPDSLLKDVSKKFTIDFFRNGTVILTQGETEVTHFNLIMRGGVKVYHHEPDGTVSLSDFRGEGGHFGALGIIKQSKANHTVETVEDTFCYQLAADDFLDLIQISPSLTRFFLESFSDQIVAGAYADLRGGKTKGWARDGIQLFSARVHDVLTRSPEMIAATATIQQAAQKMADLQIGSLLVTDGSGEVVGIVTDNDFRTKVVAKGLDYTNPVERIASSPVKTVSDKAVCFDALLHMMNTQVHHLAVKSDDGIVGVITAHDVMIQQGTSPISLFRQIVAQNSLDGLYHLSPKIPLIVGTLIEEGAKAENIVRLISVLNDHVVAKVLSLLSEEMGEPPTPYCWLMMGSEGRREQTFKTDQDNALLYETPSEEWDAVKEAKLYFRRFGNAAIEHLEKCGYPLCPGEIMASNPKWRKPYSVWQSYFDRWMSAPEPQALLHATIFFDFRSGFGTTSLAERLRSHVAKEARRRGLFLMHMAKDCLNTRPPLSIFRNFIVEKDGRHKNRLDIKTRGIVAFVDFARVLSLRHGVEETNTFGRLRALADGGFISRDLYAEIREAFEYLMQIRLVHQFRRLRAGFDPDNYIDPVDLSDSEKQTLKDSFGVIGRMQSFLKNELKVVE